MSKRLSRQWLLREWCRSCFIVGMHGGFAEGRRTAVLLRFANSPGIKY